jgi:hypothetical protein
VGRATIGTTPVLVHLAVNVAAPDRAGVEARLVEARRWLVYLLELPDVTCGRIAWSAPWTLYAQALPPDQLDYVERANRDVMTSLERADAVVGIGRHTPWLEVVLAAGARHGLPTLNLTTQGLVPPRAVTPQWWQDRPHVELITELRGVVAAVDRRRGAAEETKPA